MFWTYFAATPVAPRYFHSVPFLSWFALSQQTSLKRFLLVCLITLMAGLGM
jgi:hypothetical protein